ncbi:hypothetical protein PM082_006850 [Marasmius tenuissimus]|nr:hypothetical protein PM082_006850 [Marasmius tenuissimus]
MRLSVYHKRLQRVRQLEIQHSRSIKSYDFKRGDLVLVRNTRFDKTIGNKTRMRYVEPMIVLSRNKGGAYIVCELDGTVWKSPVDLDKFLDVTSSEFDELRSSDAIDEEGLESFDGPLDDDELLYLYTPMQI